MISIANQRDTDEIINYIRPNKINCLYLYTNLLKYGLNNPNQTVWVDKDENGIREVYLKYYDCIHYYSSEYSYDLDKSASFICEKKPKTIFTPKYVKLHDIDFYRNYYCHEEVTIFKKVDCSTDEYNIQLATCNDISMIVKIMMSDHEYMKIYSEETLTKQLIDRMSNGYCRFFILKEGKNIVATISTNAEIEDMAIIGGLVVDKTKRGRGYGTALMRYLQHVLIMEKKEAYSIVISESSKAINVKLGNIPITTVNKYYLK